jgi:hypothetical protein
VWPSEGDRVWAEGHWVFDCGHANEDQSEPRYNSEIHPPRAVASMRDQAATLPGTGATPVPATATDLYIHGVGGFVVDQLNCGMAIILGDHGDTCGQATPPPPETYKTTPIDVDFSFDVCLPPQPPGGGAFSTRVDPGPGNTVAVAPVLTPVPAAGACLGNPRFDQALMMRVDVPLAGTGTPPDAVYGRRIYAGWVAPPDPVLPRRRLTLKSMDLHEDHDLDPGDGELTFTWMNLNRAPQSWLRLSDFANGNMNDYDDDFAFGDGEMTFNGASFDFYLRHGDDYSFRARGYEQDCFDTDNNFGDHRLRRLMYVGCYADLPNAGAGDAIADANAAFAAGDLGPETVSGGGEYDLRVEVEELPLADEDASDLSVGSSCAAEGEVALVGSPVFCTTDVDNLGPGLPRQVGLTASVAPGGASVVIEGALWTFADPFGTGLHTCPLGGAPVSDVSCDLGTVPVAGHATVDVTLRPTSPGLLTEVATAATASMDDQPSNDTASAAIEVFVPVRVDIQPGRGRNVMNPRSNRTIVVAILSASDFDATTVDVSTTCFGDAEEPDERACHTRPGQDHVRDVDKDGLDDLVLHYGLAHTGIDRGDRRACVKGRTTAGVGFFGCDSILTMRPNPQPRRPGRGGPGGPAARGDVAVLEPPRVLVP